jgi:hypothetical protein
MQFESGAQEIDAGGPFPAVALRFEDTATTSWYAYGVREGIPRLLDLWDQFLRKDEIARWMLTESTLQASA